MGCQHVILEKAVHDNQVKRESGSEEIKHASILAGMKMLVDCIDI